MTIKYTGTEISRPIYKNATIIKINHKDFIYMRHTNRLVVSLYIFLR